MNLQFASCKIMKKLLECKQNQNLRNCFNKVKKNHLFCKKIEYLNK